MAKFLDSKAAQIGAGATIALWMSLVKRTTRWEVRHFQRVAPIIDSGEGLIALTWHSRFALLNSAWKRGWQRPHVMISLSREGNVVHYTSRALGLSTIRGSSRKPGSAKRKGGDRAASEALEALERGGCVVITPDGPRGPRQRLQMGALRLARASGAPLVPCAFAVSRRKVARSWDGTVLPGLFGRGTIVWGEPVRVADDMDAEGLEALRLAIEARMNADLAEADAACGHSRSLPA